MVFTVGVFMKKTLPALLLAFLFSSNPAWASEAETVRVQDAPAVQAYEYRLFRADLFADVGALSAKLNEMGQQGWYLVDVSQVVVNGTYTEVRYLFSRPLSK